MTTYLTYYPAGTYFAACVINSDNVPTTSCYATSLHDYLNLVNCDNEVTMLAKTFDSEVKTVTTQIIDSLYTGLITFDQFTKLNFILHKTLLAYNWKASNV